MLFVYPQVFGFTYTFDLEHLIVREEEVTVKQAITLRSSIVFPKIGSLTEHFKDS